MKKILITLFTVLMVIVIGWAGYHKLMKDTDKKGDEALVENTLPQPSVTLIPAETAVPSVTVIPSEAVTPTPGLKAGIYPAYKYINDVRKYGFINEKGEFIIQPDFANVSDFSEGIAIVYDNNFQNKAITTDGTEIFETNDTIEDFHNGAAAFRRYADNYIRMGYIDTTGKIIIDPVYRMADSFNKDNQAYVSKDIGNYALIDKSGNILVGFDLDSKYDDATILRDGYVIYTEKGSNKMGVVTVKGEVIFEPKFSDITYLGNDLFAMKDPSIEYYFEVMNSPAAIFNRKGEQLTDYNLYDLSNYNGDYASATDSKYTFFIGLDGKEVTTLPKFEGRGTLKMTGDVVKADIDQNLFYTSTTGAILWQADNNRYLLSGITIKEMKYKPNKYVLVYYPQVEGLTDTMKQSQINDQLKSLFTENRANLKEEDMLSVEDNFSAQLMNGLLIIAKNGYDYPFGAAHGMPIRIYYHIDIKTGSFYQLSDLFLKDSAYATKLNADIKKQMEEQAKNADSMFLPDSFQGISENQNFIITKDALIIYFTPYEIAAYAAGFPQFSIPYPDLKDFIDYYGAFWKSFQ